MNQIETIYGLLYIIGGFGVLTASFGAVLAWRLRRYEPTETQANSSSPTTA